jgi:sec-independent protein translocase protein TatA
MTPLFAWVPGPMELMLLAGLGVLLFGRRLPEVGRYLGKGIVEFKKGIRGLEDDVDTNVTRQEPVVEAPRPPQRVVTTAPKFEDSPTSPPSA